MVARATEGVQESLERRMQLNELPILHAHRRDEPRKLLLVFQEEFGARVTAAAAFGATQGARM
jgi:hypothetical protein